MYYISYFFIKMANGGHRKVNEAVLNGWLGKLVRLTILCALGWGIPNNHAGLNKSLCVFHLTWQKFLIGICPSYHSRKKETSETFLSLGRTISWSRPMALTSKMWPRLQKTFPRFPFFYFDNLDKSQIRRRQIFPQSSQHNFQNKILIIF